VALKTSGQPPSDEKIGVKIAVQLIHAHEGERMKATSTKAARALRKRKATMDASIARVQRKVKSLTRMLRKQTSTLNKRKARRAKLK
jgi:hypothetical protein